MIRKPRTITFNNQISSDLEIIINKIRRPILPALRPKKLTVGSMDGAWDFGNNKREEITISIDCTIPNPLDKTALHRLIAKWLSIKSYLIISDEPDKYYIGRIYDVVSEDVDGPIGTFTLEFICDPFAYDTTSSTDEVLLGDDIPLGSDITLGNSNNYMFNITAPDDVIIENVGTRDIRPTIIINGSLDNITVAINGKSLTYSSPISSNILIIDGENYNVEVDMVNKLSEITGDIDDFLTLYPGNNTVTITGSNLNCTVQFEFRPRYY